MTTASFHKTNRNHHYRLIESGGVILTETVSDNGFIARMLPYYNESQGWLKPYLGKPEYFINYVLYSATYTGSEVEIPSHVSLVDNIPKFQNFRYTDSLYNSQSYKSYELLRLKDKSQIKLEQKGTVVKTINEPLLFDNKHLSERIYNSFRETPIDFSAEAIEYNIENIIKGYTPVTDNDFAHKEVNEYYNNTNRNRKYDSIKSILTSERSILLKHRQTVFPNQNDIWNRVRPYFTCTLWHSNQDYRKRESTYIYDYSGDEAVYSTSPGLLDWDPNFGTEFNYGKAIDFSFNTKPLEMVTDVFLGGEINSFGGSPRFGLGSVDKDLGISHTPWPETTAAVNDILYDRYEDIVYVAGLMGGYATIGGETRTGLAAIDNVTKTVLPFDADIGSLGGPSNGNCLYLDEDNLYIGGDFSDVAGSTRNRVACVNKTTAVLQPFDVGLTPPDAYSYSVQCFESNDEILYMGGYFSLSSTVSRSKLAAVDKDIGDILLFDPNPNGIIYPMILFDSNLYIGGSFTTVSGLARNRIAAVNKDTGVLFPFNPNCNNLVSSMELSGSNLYLGGYFTNVSGSVRNYIAAVHKDTGALLPFNPNCDSAVDSMIISGSNLYLGGGFTTVSGTPRNYIAAVDKDTGALLPFNPNCDNGVSSMLISGSNLYIVGFFTTVSGSTRNRIAAVHKDTGALLPFNPNCNNIIYSMVISGSNLYFCGEFTNVSGSTRNRIAAVHKDTGALLPFNPNCNGLVYSMELSGSNLYLGGAFTIVSGSTRNNIAAVDKDTGALFSFSPSCDDFVFSMELSGSNLYLGGLFNIADIEPKTSNNLTAVNKSTGIRYPFNPNPNGYVSCLLRG